MTSHLPARAGSLMLALLAAVAVACSSAVQADPTPVSTWPITPASPGFVASATAAAAAAGSRAAAVTPAAPAPASGGATLRVRARNLLFDPTSLTAAPGALTIELDNADGGVPHNIQFFKGTDAKGASIGKSDIVSGPATSTLALTVAPGVYFFQCDVHPTTMTGTLTVK